MGKALSFCSTKVVFAFSLILYFAKLHLSALKLTCFSPACFLDTGVPEVGLSLFVLIHSVHISETLYYDLFDCHFNIWSDCKP